MTIQISKHAEQRINQRFPQLKNYSYEEINTYFLGLIDQSLIIYRDGNEIVYVGLKFMIVLSADNRHKLVTVLSA